MISKRKQSVPTCLRTDKVPTESSLISAYKNVDQETGWWVGPGPGAYIYQHTVNSVQHRSVSATIFTWQWQPAASRFSSWLPPLLYQCTVTHSPKPCLSEVTTFRGTLAHLPETSQKLSCEPSRHLTASHKNQCHDPVWPVSHVRTSEPSAPSDPGFPLTAHLASCSVPSQHASVKWHVANWMVTDAVSLHHEIQQSYIRDRQGCLRLMAIKLTVSTVTQWTATHFSSFWFCTLALRAWKDTVTLRLKCRLWALIWGHFHPYQMNPLEMTAACILVQNQNVKKIVTVQLIMELTAYQSLYISCIELHQYLYVCKV